MESQQEANMAEIQNRTIETVLKMESKQDLLNYGVINAMIILTYKTTGLIEFRLILQ